MKKNLHKELISRVFSIRDDADFNDLALEICRIQYENVAIYRSFCDGIGRDVYAIKDFKEIPFLPIQFFKSHTVLWGEMNPNDAKLFLSSGTTLSGRSKHYVADLEVYRTSFRSTFQQFYGDVQDIAIIALLPSYQEQGNSSLIYMVDDLIETSNNPLSGYYLDDKNIINVLREIEKKGSKAILFGVSYALVDLIESHKFNLSNVVIMETGGMKGRRKELTKSELHKLLSEGFGTSNIHSEYGMTELLSQGYSQSNEWFSFPKWMKVLLRPTNDPLAIIDQEGKTGGVNVIDLANIYSCSFIATQDLGKLNRDQLRIMGRFDYADIRGCNLLVQ